MNPLGPFDPLADTTVSILYLPPLLLVASVLYGATRYETWPFILDYAWRWCLYSVGFLGGTAGMLYLLELDLPQPVYWGAALVVAGWMLRGFAGRPKPAAVEKPAADKSVANKPA